MRYKVVCIRDRAADVFGMPNFVMSIGGAIRSFSDEVNRQADGNQLNLHPGDFDLYELGVFDDEWARFEPLADGPRQIAIGKDLLRDGFGS